MKKLLMLILLLNSAMVTKAMLVTLPEAAVLEKRLSKMPLEHFLKVTNIHEKLSQKNLTPDEVYSMVVFAIFDYAAHLEAAPLAVAGRLRLDYIIEAVLQDWPAARVQLEKEKTILKALKAKL